MGFQQLGGGNVWINGTGNPALAPEVKIWQRGYTRQSTAAGYKIRGAQVSEAQACLALVCMMTAGPNCHSICKLHTAQLP